MTDLDRLVQNLSVLEVNRRLTEAHHRMQDVAWDDLSLRELLMCWTAQREEILRGVFG